MAAHLDGDGSFVVEALVPSFLYRLRDHQYVGADTVEVDRVTLDVSRYDPVTQLQEESHIAITPDGIRLHPIATRYIWPSELDLMARIAGLTLRDRWADWNRSPFTSESRKHVSAWVKG